MITENRYLKRGLPTLVVAVAIIAFLFTLGGDTRCAQAQASCGVGDDEIFAGSLGIQSSTTNTLTQSAAGITANRAIAWGDFAGEPVIVNATQTVSSKTFTTSSYTSPTITGSPTAAGATWADLGAVSTVDINAGTVDATIGGTTPAVGTFTTLTGTTIDGVIGSVTPAVGEFTTGLFVDATSDQLTGDGEIVTLNSTGDVSHGVTSITSAVTWGFLKKINGDSGGIQFVGLADGDGGTTAMRLMAILDATAADTAKATTGIGIIDMRAGLESGNSIGVAGADETLFGVRNNSTAVWLLDAEGDSWQTGAAGFLVGSDPAGDTDTAHIYAKDDAASAEIYVRDEAGNVTKISPHDPLTNHWVFDSCNDFTGRCLEIDMEAALTALGALLGETLITETFMPVADRLDWDSVEAGKAEKSAASINSWNARLASGVGHEDLGDRPDQYIARGKPAWLAD